MLQSLVDNFLRWIVTVLLIVTAVCAFLLLLAFLLWTLYACLYGARREHLSETTAQKPLLEVLEPPPRSSPPVVLPPPVRPIDNGVGVVPLMAARTNRPPPIEVPPVEIEIPPAPRNTSQTEDAAFSGGNQAREAARQFEILSRSSATEEEAV